MMKRVVFLTGAGMSAESGIATFRDSGGLWDKYPVEQVATPEAFARNPQLVLEFYNIRRRELFATQPNAGHRLIAELEQDFNVCIVTQNIDNLHERAGSSHVVHLHGELTKVHSVRGEHLMYELTADKPDIQVGDKAEDGAQLRPFVVWFGEAVPKMDEAIALAQSADVFVVVGTSLNVYPAAGLLSYVPRGVPVFLIDPAEVSCTRPDVRVIRKTASEGLAQLAVLLRGGV